MPTAIVFGFSTTFNIKKGAMTFEFNNLTLIYNLKAKIIQLFKNEQLFEELDLSDCFFSLKDYQQLLLELKETNTLTKTNLNYSILSKYGKTN